MGLRGLDATLLKAEFRFQQKSRFHSCCAHGAARWWNREAAPPPLPHLHRVEGDEGHRVLAKCWFILGSVSRYIASVFNLNWYKK